MRSTSPIANSSYGLELLAGISVGALMGGILGVILAWNGTFVLWGVLLWSTIGGASVGMGVLAGQLSRIITEPDSRWSTPLGAIGAFIGSSALSILLLLSVYAVHPAVASAAFGIVTAVVGSLSSRRHNRRAE